MRHALLILAVVGLAGGCQREQPEVPPRIERAGAGSSAPGAGGSARASAPGAGSARSADAIPPQVLIDTAREGLGYLMKRAKEYEQIRTRQVEKLDRKLAQIQELLAAGKLDEAEVLLVDIHWIPVEPGATAEADFVRTYDDKRTSLARFIESKRSRAP